jgi:hypothetical protein
MKNLILGAAIAALAAACGGGGKPQLLDGGVDGQLICDPIAQTGCKANQKCTWVVDANPTTMSAQLGHVDCAAVDATAIPDGMTCVPAMAGISGGADNCARGDICISSVCKPICDPQLASGAGAGACDTTHACLSYRGVFATAQAPIAGACEVACDPLTQQLATTKAEACGSNDPANPTATCVPTSSEFKAFACAPALTRTATDRMPPAAPPDDPSAIVGNGCAPGFLPFFFDSSGNEKTLCSGMCAPVKMDSTIFADAKTPINQKPYGNTAALGKLPTDTAPVMGHATCQSAIKGALTDAEGTEDCRFIWFPLAISQVPPAIVDTPNNNRLGMCFAYSKFTLKGPNNTTVPEKSCKDLGTAPDATFGTAEENGCYPLDGFPPPAARTTSWLFKPNPNRMGNLRLSYGPAVMVRPVFD